MRHIALQPVDHVQKLFQLFQQNPMMEFSPFDILHVTFSPSKLKRIQKKTRTNYNLIQVSVFSSIVLQFSIYSITIDIINKPELHFALDRMQNLKLTKVQCLHEVYIHMGKYSYYTKRTLTNMCTQCVQIMPIITVPRPPNNRPAFLNAIGIASIPVPSELFSRCAKAPIVLQNTEKFTCN